MIEYDPHIVNPYTMYNQKPKVEWIATAPGVEEVMPIIKATDYKHTWIQKAVADMKSGGSVTAKHRQDYEMPEAPQMNQMKPDDERHTAKCPGLQLLNNTGWIMRLHQDIRIRTIGNGEDITWIIPFQSQQHAIVSKHMTHSFYPFFDNWPKDTMKKILKINLPWKARIPKGYKLLQTHPFLLDDFRFTTMSGVLDPHLGLAAVGVVPMWWHTTNDEVDITLKAGTPLAQFILIPKEEPDFTQVNHKDDLKYDKEENIGKLLLAGTFKRNYAKVREFWKKYGW